MMWLAPAFLAAGTLIGLPVFLHLLRRKPREVIRFPSLQFLTGSAVRETRRHRIRRWITLVLRCLVILLLVGAFARPFFQAQHATSGRALVIAVDNSMSMQVEGRWEKLKQWAWNEMGELRAGDRAGLLLMHPTPEWLVPMTSEIEQVRAGLQDLKPGFQSTSYEPALRLAAATLDKQPAGEKWLIWMADEQRNGWAGLNFQQALPSGVQFVFAEPQKLPQQQAGITRATVRQEKDSLLIEGTVQLVTPAELTSTVTAEVNGKVMGSSELKLRAAGETPFSMAVANSAQSRAEPLAVVLRITADSLSADNSYYLVLNAEPPTTLTLDRIDESCDFLEQALQSTSELSTGKVLPVGWKVTQALPGNRLLVVRPQTLQSGEAVRSIENFIRGGGTAWVWADESPGTSELLKAAGVQAQTWEAVEEGRHLRGWDPDHPILKVFSGSSLLPVLESNFYRGVTLSIPDTADRIASWSNGDCAIGLIPMGVGRLFVTGFLPEREATDWLVKASFVPWVHSVVRWLEENTSSKQQWLVGDSIPLAGHGSWTSGTGPESSPPRSVADSVTAEAPGIYTFEREDRRTLFAVNVASQETDITPWAEPRKLQALQAPVAREKSSVTYPADARVSEQQQGLWWWIMAAAGLFMLGEVCIANRTAL